MDNLEVIFCASGWLGEIALKTALKIEHIKIKLILTDLKSEKVIKLAKKNSLSVYVGKPRVGSIKEDLSCDVIASVNYLFVLPCEIFQKAKIFAFNVHGSLLPKYMGRTPVTWVIINDEIETGVTVHEMVADVDSGDIIYQQKIPIANDDTGGSLLEKMAKCYPMVLRKTFEQIRDNKIKRIPQDLQKKTYFGKREPADGLIDWRWSARRIYNWVRAQTSPYPGAFGYIKGIKYLIWEVKECYFPVSPGNPGTILSNRKGIFVRCGQGVVKFVNFSVDKA